MVGNQHTIRREIEGLRAVAVVAVILFHFGVSWLPGGFLGVDVFFVISGFLITSNVLRDMHGERFSFRGFYLRRFLRLFPALATTALATLAVSFALLPPDEVLDLAQSAVAAIFAVSNIYFWSKVGYFDTAAHLKPLLHTWSLGVEEQFYLFWPAALLFTLRYFGVKVSAWIVGFAGVASLVAAQTVIGNSPSTVFYWMPFRIFEFALGIMIAIPWFKVRLTGALANMVGWFGLASIVGAFLLLRDNVPMPSAWSLIACAGAAVVILVGNVPPIAPLLSNVAMTFIGRISYSLYLVHWPVAVFMPLGTSLEKALALAVCLGLAALQFYAVEHPLRRGTRSVDLTTTPKALGVAASIIGATFAMSGYAAYSDGLRFRLPPELRNIQSANTMWNERNPTVRVGTCFILPDQTFKDFDQAECLDLKPGRKNVLLVGDSIAADMYSVLKQAYPDVNFLEATSGSCVPLAGNKMDTNCEALMRFIFDDFAGREGLDAVVLSASWHPSDVDPGIRESIDALAGKVDRIVLLGPPIRFTENVPDLIFASRAVTIAAVEQFVFAHRHPADEMTKPILEMYAKRAETISIEDVMCRGRCRLFDDEGNLIFLDFAHLTKAGATYLAGNMKAAYPNLF
ncbi:acyltransferase [Mesorhizobium australicum]|uniref:acyltransferase family protein n=1 Tax=Mesorhizobium australicum TaxID=536018 RepID=UPI00333D9944